MAKDRLQVKVDVKLANIAQTSATFNRLFTLLNDSITETTGAIKRKIPNDGVQLRIDVSDYGLAATKFIQIISDQNLTLRLGGPSAAPIEMTKFEASCITGVVVTSTVETVALFMGTLAGIDEIYVTNNTSSEAVLELFIAN